MATSQNPKVYGYISKYGSTKHCLRMENTHLPNDFLEVFADSLSFNTDL